MVSHSFNLTPYTYASSIPLSLFKERGNKRGVRSKKEAGYHFDKDHKKF
jgi:hypothetical protein